MNTTMIQLLRVQLLSVDASLAVVVMDVVAATSNPDYVVAHGSTDSMKQAARRYRKKNLPGTGKLKNIKKSHD